jgi:basic amino acid/polyamine antiporter, APA family
LDDRLQNAKKGQKGRPTALADVRHPTAVPLRCKNQEGGVREDFIAVGPPGRRNLLYCFSFGLRSDILKAMTTSTHPQRSAEPQRQLTLFDSTCIIVGIIIAAGIYRSSPVIAALVPSVGWLFGVWLLGGVLSLVGALCYVELGTAYPREGGDYVYLSRAFGRTMGFVFAWAQLWVVRPGSIGAMAYAFADYAHEIWPGPEGMDAKAVKLGYAIGSILLLSTINIVGVREGKWTQNLLTTAKVLGLTAVFVVGMCLAAPQAPVVAAAQQAAPSDFGIARFGLAMVFVLFTYGGWNEMAYVGAEVRDPRKNILRAMLLGTVAVTVIYLLVNAAFLHALGLDGARKPTVAADVLQLGVGDWAGRLISVLVCISALGAINGQIFTGARIYSAMGKDHRLYAWLGQWSPRFGTPVFSLVAQAAITLALVAGFGMSKSGFDSMVIFTTPVFWLFLALVGVAVFVLRYREPATERPYRVPGYPLPPIIFCLSSLFMVYSSLDYAWSNRSWEAFWAVGLLLAGGVMALFDVLPRTKKR